MNLINVNYGVNFGKLGPNIEKLLQDKGPNFYKNTKNAKEIINKFSGYKIADINEYKGIGYVVTLDGCATKQQPVLGPDSPNMFMQIAKIIKAEVEKSDDPVGNVKGCTTLRMGEIVREQLEKLSKNLFHQLHTNQ